MATLKKTKQRTNKRELHQKEADAKYSSLLVQSKKSIRKELKVVKSFECQKIIRKIKSVKEELEQQYEQEQEQEQQEQQEQEEANGKVKVSDGQHGNDNVNHVRGDEGVEVKEDKGHSSSQTKLTVQQQQQLEKLDAKLKLIKNFDIDCALKVALQRVGLNLDVMETEDDKKDKNSNDNDRQDDDDDKHDDDDHSGDKQVDNPTNNNNNNNTNNNTNNNIIETLLKHKRVSSAMQSINEKVADYNLWLSRREEWLANGCKGPVGRIERNITADGMHTMRKKRSRNDDTVLDMAGHDGASGLFIESLAGNSMTDPPPVNGNTSHGITEGCEDGYEEGDSSYFVDPYPPPLKKNRPGQRARKAKAMAIEAKKAGRVWDSSVNWREKKKKQKQKKPNEKGDKETDVVNNKQEMMISASGLDKSKDIKVSEVVNMGKDWKEQGKAHPSWAAREAQKAKSGLGMVAFAGKKITFDD